MAIWEADKQMVGIVALAWQKSEHLASKDRSDFEGMIILPEIPQGRRNESMKKTNGRSRTNPQNSGTKPKLMREANRKEANNMVNNHHINMA